VITNRIKRSINATETVVMKTYVSKVLIYV